MDHHATDDHVADMLPAYVNGTLDAETAARVAAHLPICAACRNELAEWRALAGAASTLSRHSLAPADALLDRVWAEIDGATSAPRYRSRQPMRRLPWLWSLLVGQLPLVRRGIWTASALTIGLGCLLALLNPVHRGSATPIAILAPVIAALGVAFVYGPETDPGLELALATPTPPRLVLLCRLTLVYGYDLALALVATALLGQVRGAALWPVIALWLGPMLLLSGLSLLLSLLFRPTVGMMGALTLWVTDVLTFEARWRANGFGSDALAAFWRNTALLVPLAVALFAVAILWVASTGRWWGGAPLHGQEMV
jgi:hypothetical protein